MKEKTFHDLLLEGKALREQNTNIDFDITKCKLPESFKVYFINVINNGDVNLCLQDFLEFTYILYYNCMCLREGYGCEPFLQSIKHLKGKYTLNRRLIYDTLTETWEKNALSLPAYKRNKNNQTRKIFKDFMMKDYMMALAHYTHKSNVDSVPQMELERCKVKVSNATFFVFACMYTKDYAMIEKVYSTIIKNKNAKLFEACLLDDFIDIVRCILKAKGVELSNDGFEEKERYRELCDENQEKIDLMAKEYNKIIDGLKSKIAELSNENTLLKNQLELKNKEIERLTEMNKLRNKNILLIGDKPNRQKYEDTIRKYDVKNYTFLDSFEDHSRIVSVASNSDYVFHLTEKSKHNVSNLLKSCNANVVMVEKNSQIALENAICNL